jgi:hypothetical protein
MQALNLSALGNVGMARRHLSQTRLLAEASRDPSLLSMLQVGEECFKRNANPDKQQLSKTGKSQDNTREDKSKGRHDKIRHDKAQEKIG